MKKLIDEIFTIRATIGAYKSLNEKHSDTVKAYMKEQKLLELDGNLAQDFYLSF